MSSTTRTPGAACRTSVASSTLIGLSNSALMDSLCPFNTGTLARLALIPTYINEHYLTTFRADGLIVASPTGSTAYSMVAGGPVVHPQVPGIVITPICPFTLTNRPLVVPDVTRILIKPEERATNLILTLDGQAGVDIQHGDTILIEKSPHPVHMIRIPGSEYFDVLKAKLSWSGGRA